MIKKNAGVDDDGHWRLLSGTLVVAVLLLFTVAGLLLLAVGRDRNVVHYPGASPISSHSNYGGLPRQIRWDNSYFTTDNFTTVYNWYSTTFDLGAESRAIERCILLEGPFDQVVVERYVSVLLCSAPEGQFIYVTRTTALKLD